MHMINALFLPDQVRMTIHLRMCFSVTIRKHRRITETILLKSVPKLTLHHEPIIYIKWLYIIKHIIFKKYLPPCHQNIRYSFYEIQLCNLLPIIIVILVGNIFLQYIKINIYYFYIHNIIIIIITNMTSHAQYLKVDYKSSLILYYKSYAIIVLVTCFHPCTIKRDHTIFYRIAWDCMG